MSIVEVMTKLIDSNVGKRLAAFLGSIYAITETDEIVGKIIIAGLCVAYMGFQTISDWAKDAALDKKVTPPA